MPSGTTRGQCLSIYEPPWETNIKKENILDNFRNSLKPLDNDKEPKIISSQDASLVVFSSFYYSKISFAAQM